jgi:hypothetical protein
MVDDPRYRTKVFLDTYLVGANMLKDDSATQMAFITTYSDPDYPMDHVFYDPKNRDLVFSIGQPRSTVAHKVDWDGTIKGYLEAMPVTVQTVKKPGMEGNKALWTAEAELRRIVETNPSGSYRSIRRVGNPQTVDMGGWFLFQQTYVITYERDTT